MQASSNKSQSSPHKVKNILIRRSHKLKFDEDYRHPEISYILKYAPKYYKGLAFEMVRHNPLFSKVKKIKKLQKFTGFFKEHFPQELWLNLLSNNRKEIEEIPQITSSKFQTGPSQSFWKRFNMRKIKFFLNVRKVSLPRRELNSIIFDKYVMAHSDNFFFMKENFVRYLWGLRKLKSLKIIAKLDYLRSTKYILEKLNGKNRFVNKLEALKMNLRDEKVGIQEFLPYKNVLSHLTELKLPQKFDPIFCEILQACKNLKTLSLKVRKITDKEEPEFLSLLTSIQSLSQLECFDLIWPSGTRNFWAHFKPQPFLKNLKLEFASPSLIDEGLSERDIQAKDLVGHWEDIQELNMLEIHASFSKAQEIVLMRRFITMILKKVSKLRSLKVSLTGPVESNLTYEPFLVEEVAHLYESLETFENGLSNRVAYSWTKFNLRIMKPFRNLKEMKFYGDCVLYENVEDAVSLLEGSHKEGDYPTLELVAYAVSSPDWLGATLKKIEKVKRLNSNLKIVIDFRFRGYYCFDPLERLCRDIQAVNSIKGLMIILDFHNNMDYPHFPTEEICETLSRFTEIRNLRVEMMDEWNNLDYRNIDGEKQRLLIKSFDFMIRRDVKTAFNVVGNKFIPL